MDIESPVAELDGLHRVDDKSSSPPDVTQMTLEFRGSAGEYFRIWIVNLCLTLLTLGFFSPWAKVRKKRYFYSHMILDGTPFQYLGQPLPILKGRLIAAVFFLAYFLASNIFHSMLPYVLIPAVIAAPWMLARSAAFNARYSAFRNMTFDFRVDYKSAAKAVYAYGVVPVFVGATLLGWSELSKEAMWWFFFCGAFFPFWTRTLRAFLIKNISFGGKPGEFTATRSQYGWIYFSAVLIFLILLVPFIGIFVGVFIKKKLVEVPIKIIPWVMSGALYFGYALAYSFVQTRISNLAWNNTRLGPLRFQSDLRVPGMASLYFSNAVAIIASAGLLIPWAIMRTLKYKTQHLKVSFTRKLSEFQGSPSSAVSAVGAETMDIFDLDIAL